MASVSRLEQLKLQLTEQVALLQRESLPIDLAVLCDELKVDLKFERSHGSRMTGGYRRTGRTPQVVLYRTTSHQRLSAHERFTVAHELGHHLIEQAGGFLVTRRRDYWACEEVCNSFAADLLVPSAVVLALGEPKDGVQLAEMIRRVAAVCDVSPPVAAKSIIPRLTTPVAAGKLRVDPYPRTGRVGFRLWWVENRKWWGKRWNARVAAYSGHPIASAIDAIERLEPGATTTSSADGVPDFIVRRLGGIHASFAGVLATAD